MLRRIFSLTTAGLTAALLVAACSSGSKSSTATSAPTSPTSAATSATSAAGTGQSSGLALAQARVQQFSAAPTALAITTPVQVPKKQLTIAYTQCAQVVCQAIGQGIQEAAAALGAKYVVFHHQDTADTVQAAFQDALQANPDMVLTSGDPTQWFQSQLSQLNAKHVPVIGWSLPQPYKGDGIAANLITGDDYYFNGVLMADYITAKSNGKADVLIVNVPQYPVLADEAQGIKDEFAKVCADCKTTSLDFTVAQVLQGAHIPAAVAAIQKDPGIKWVIAGFGGLMPGMPQAFQNAGFSGIQAVSQAGTSANYQLIKSGQLQVADIGLPTEFLGWRAVDAGLRALAGQDVGSYPKLANTDIPGHPDILVSGVPLKILTAPDLTDPSKAWTPFPDYQSQFKKLWGLG